MGPGDGSKMMKNIDSNEPKKIPYPKRVFFIIATEFCERINFSGMSAILALFLKYKLDYNEDDATVLFHVITMMVYFMCIFGGIISDVSLGKYKTILYLSIVYSIGCIVVAVSSIPDNNFSPKVLLMVGLIFIAIGSGGIKPCVAAFGGDQFKLPEQTAQADSFFSIYYFALAFGVLIGTIIMPILRQDVHCFGDNDCFPLAFGVPAIFMLMATGFFVVAKSTYTHRKTSSENVLVQVTKCIANAISTKIRDGRKNPRKNFLDYSIDKYGEQLVNETRGLLRLLVLYIPVPFYFALHDQRSSRWTFQANQMNGDIGFYTIKPDQMQVAIPFLILTCIPLFETVVYPILRVIGIRRPLQKMVIGGMMAAASFLLSTFVQFKIDSSPEKSMSMLWLVPQNFAMSAAEVMFAITGLAFAYEQAPDRMKSAIMALWLTTGGFGNLIVLFVAKTIHFDSQAHEFLLFSGLMFVDMLIFMALAHNYKSVAHNEVESKEKHKLKLDVPVKRLEEMTPL